VSISPRHSCCISSTRSLGRPQVVVVAGSSAFEFSSNTISLVTHTFPRPSQWKECSDQEKKESEKKEKEKKEAELEVEEGGEMFARHLKSLPHKLLSVTNDTRRGEGFFRGTDQTDSPKVLSALVNHLPPSSPSPPPFFTQGDSREGRKRLKFPSFSPKKMSGNLHFEQLRNRRNLRGPNAIDFVYAYRFRRIFISFWKPF
jgi:hypothetical protein